MERHGVGIFRRRKSPSETTVRRWKLSKKAALTKGSIIPEIGGYLPVPLGMEATSTFYRRRKRLGDFLYRVRLAMPALSAKGGWYRRQNMVADYIAKLQRKMPLMSTEGAMAPLYQRHKLMGEYLVRLRREIPAMRVKSSSALFRRRKLMGEYLAKLRRDIPALSAKGTTAFVRKIPSAIKATASDLIRMRVFRQLLDMASAFRKMRLRHIPALGVHFAGQSVAYAAAFGRRMWAGNMALSNLRYEAAVVSNVSKSTAAAVPKQAHSNLFAPSLKSSSRSVFSLGFVSGVVLAVLGGITYARYNIPILQNAIANLSMKSFDMAKSYEKRKWIYLTFPEYNMRFLKGVEAKITFELSKLWRRGDSGDNFAMELLLKTEADLSSQNSAATPLSMKEAWSVMVLKAADLAKSSQLLKYHAVMKEALISEVIGDETLSIKEKVLELRELLPPSVERDYLVDEMLQGHMSVHNWLPAHVLEANPPHDPPQICDPWNAIIRLAVLFYPGALNHLILFLDGQMTAEEVVQAEFTVQKHAGNEHATYPSVEEAPRSQKNPMEDPLSQKNLMALKVLKEQYGNLAPRLQDHVLQSAVTAKIDLLPTISGHEMSSKSVALSRALSRSRAGDKESLSPHQLYVNSIDNDLLGPLRRDAKIPRRALKHVKTVFLGLPSEIQARVLLTAIRHPSSRGTVSPKMQATVVRDLMSAGGVVAVKLGQMISEDSRVPQHYKELLGSLRDDNAPLELCEFWHSIPTTMKSLVSHVGPALGTGSVKDVRKVRLWPHEDCALAVLRKRVEDEALASLTALQASPELEPIATRLGRLVYREFNLYEEGEALEEFAHTSIGMHPKFRIVKVKHHNPKCLIEDIAEG
jgi:hypothetical protein